MEIKNVLGETVSFGVSRVTYGLTRYAISREGCREFVGPLVTCKHLREAAEATGMDTVAINRMVSVFQTFFQDPRDPTADLRRVEFYADGHPVRKEVCCEGPK